ncbi:adenylate/guanylate cyclase domain-containing protein [Reyranella sp.]|uniref:adenylate/guanylate cyclase domain-containing protein n=1 Tax=Reyranella sp. TaxID=1929291 RepID=UPI0025E76051|nr:adenylate/guanylate cyclase domain-containing protein [Reyranella sp.]
MARQQRRLAAILVMDVVGSSRLMGRDESGTVARLRDHRINRLEPALLRHDGRLVKLMGDGALAEFTSALDALSAAIEFQQAMADANRDASENTAIIFRVGVHVGDVLIEEDDLLGDDVNIAKRLEEQAPGGSVVVSGTVRHAVGDRLKVGFADLGNPSLKNIERPVQAYRVTWDAEDWRVPLVPAGAFSMKTQRGRKRLGLSLAALAGIVIAAGFAYMALAPLPPPTIAQLRDLKAEDLERLLTERRAADAAAAEKKHIEDEARRKADDEAAAVRQANADLEKARQDRQKAEADLAKLKADMEARRQATAADQRQLADSAAQRSAEEAAHRQAEVEMAALRLIEEEARRKAAEEAENKRQADEALALAQAARQKADEEAAARRQAEEKVEATAQQRAQAEAAVAAALKQRTEAGAVESALRLAPADRQRLQVALTSLGFDTRGADGTFGPRSREMIASWQKKIGTPSTGFLTRSQQEALLREAAPALSKYDEKRKAEEEARTRAVVAPPAPAPSSPIVAGAASAPASAGAFDGIYNGNVPISGGGALRPVRIEVVNGKGTGTMRVPGCDVGQITITITPQGDVSGTSELTTIGTGGTCRKGSFELKGTAMGRELRLRLGGSTIYLTR